MARRRRGSQYFAKRPSRGVRGRRSSRRATRRKRRKGEKLTSKQSREIRQRTKELLIDQAKWNVATAPLTIYAGSQVRKAALVATTVERMRMPGRVRAVSVGYPKVVIRALQRKAATRAGLAIGLKLGVRAAGHFAGPFAIAFWAYDIYTLSKWVSDQ